MKRMGFGKRWMKWMEACVFSSHMFVLVNGSATKEFSAQRGLRQGDPLSPFIFVLVTALVKNSVEVGDFKPFKYGEEEVVDILQSADDTVILGEPTCDNLWSLKVLLRGFKLVSGLKTNFTKSNVLGVNNWGVTLINAVLNAIPTFSISFYKAPKKIIQEIREIQSNFLWSGDTNKRSIHWVRWEIVYKPKDKGELGVRDVRETNRALLLKWKWRILTEKDAIWRIFIDLRYLNPKIKAQANNGDIIIQGDSIWWRDVMKNNVKMGGLEEGFSSCVNCLLKNGKNIHFWDSIWLGNQTIRESFSRLSDLSTKKLSSVAEIYHAQDEEASGSENSFFGQNSSTVQGPVQTMAATRRDSVQQQWRKTFSFGT
ncbi:uncharacterized protein LOC131596892 [Vicia villosa]|uniref:uncharacterized protein LOC131596892 n=1 Tax=Vicia villosa TaxID=3911 RepID=UPI00273C9388|nr:uncharacterized protein LOC131596892 [Vicia villosa]